MKREAEILLVITAILISIGIVMIYSASSCYAYERFNDATFYLKRHLASVCLGILGSIFFVRLDYRILKKYTRPLLFFAILSLLLVFLPGIGHEAGGAKRWIKAGPLSLQPSEFARLALIIYIADFLDRKKHYITNFLYGFLPPLVISGLVIFLILIQPDLGTAVLLMLVIFAILFAAGAKIKHFIPFIAGSIPLISLLIFKVPYRFKRIIGFIDPWMDAHGSGFQMVQSYLALGSGGVFGLGLGASKQKLFYLPQSHTDFIFSIIGEELGFLGALLVVVLFIIFLWQGINISMKKTSAFGKYLALGITLSIAMQAFINIGVVSGLLPTKGLPLPFISYGGSSLIFNMTGVAILLNIANK